MSDPFRRGVSGAGTALAFVTVFALSGCSGQSDVELLQSARKHLEAGQAATASIELKNVARKRDQDGEVRFLLGRALLESGDAAGAEIELERALKLKHSPEQVLPQLARAMLALQKYRQLTDNYGLTEFRENVPTAELKTLIASAYYSQRAVDKAEGANAAALMRVPDYVPALLMQANLTAAGGDRTNAAHMVDDVVARAPDNVQAWTLKGQLHEAAGQRAEAIEAFRKALSLKPDSVSAHAALMSVYLSPPDLPAAEAQWKAMSAALPNNPQTRFYEAKLAYLHGDLRKVRELTGTLIGSGTSNVSLLQLAGATEIELKSPAQAEELLTRAMALAPGAAAPRVLLGRAYVASGQYAKAMETVHPLLESGRPPVEALVLMAQAKLMSGDARSADVLFTRAAQVLPRNTGVATAKALANTQRDASEASLGELETLVGQGAGTTAALALVSARLARGEIDRALAAVDELARSQPDQPLPDELRGRIALKQGRVDVARANFERALEKDPTHYAAVAGLAGIDLAQGKTADAQERYRTLLKHDPNHLQALLGLAEIRARDSDGAAEVVKLLSKAIEAHPGNRGPRLMLIDYHLARRDYKSAVAVAQAAVNARPGTPELLERLGQAQIGAGEVQQALITYGRLADVQPQSAVVQLTIAGIHMQVRNLGAAKAAVRRASVLAPDSLQVTRAAVSLAALDKDYVQALALARDLQKRQPDEAAGFMMEGEIEILRNDPVAAERALRAAVSRKNPGEAARRLHLMLLAKDKGEAERFAAGWVSQHRSDAQFLQHLGDRAIAEKHWATAERYYRQVVEYEPRDAQALNNVAWLLMQQGKSGASAFAERALKVSPNSPALMDTLAMAYAAEQRFDEAIKLQERAVGAAPEAGAFRLNLAKMYLSAGRTNKAREHLTWLADKGASFAGRAEVQELLAQLDRKS